MAGTGPRVARTPLELLTNQETNTIPFLSKFWVPALSGAFGVLTIAFYHYGTRRPILSGIHKHVICGGIYYLIGRKLEEGRDLRTAKRDAILRHYVELHPEDFPPYEPKLYKDVLEPWVPIR